MTKATLAATDASDPDPLRRRIAELEAEVAHLRRQLPASHRVPPLADPASGAVLAAILDHLPVGVGVVDQTGCFVLRNRAMSRYAGDRIPSRDKGFHRWRGYHPDGGRIEPQDYPGARALRGETVLPGTDLLYEQEDGQEVWTRVAAVPLHDAGWFGSGAIIVVQDIDEVKRAADELRMLAAVVEQTTDFIGIATPDERAFYVNGAGRAIVGLADMDAVRRTRVSDCFMPEDQAFVRDVILPTQYRDGRWVGEFRFRRFDTGEAVPMHYNQFVIRDERGEVLSVATVARDITREKQDREALRVAQENAERLAAERAAILGQLDEGVIVADQAGRIVFVNEAAVDLHGVERLDVGPEDYSATYRLFTEDGRPYPEEQLPLARAVLKGEIVANARWRIHRPDGAEVLAIGSARPVFAPGGAHLGAVLTMRDDTERHAAEQALALSERRLGAVLNNTTMAVFMMDHRQHCIYMNAAAEHLTGYRFEETQGRPLHDVVHHTHPDGRPFPLHECSIDRAFPANNQMQGEEVFIHRDGHFFPVAFTASPIRDEAAQAVGTILEVRDITTERENAERLQLLIGELNHRVKNTLATVQSIAWQALRGQDVPPQVREAIEARLIALSRSHDLLTRESWSHAGLKDLASEALEPFAAADGRAERFEIEGDNIRLRPKVALALGMAFHELATNAVKYGALSSDDGAVRLSWTIDGDNRLRLVWREQGGPPVEAPPRKGFGSRLIERGLAYELDGTVHLAFPRDGVVCTIEMPAGNARGVDHDHR